MGYYFISIGGSGAKVMESLTHLCAAGLLPNQEKEEQLYVMAIDPDVGNGNLKRSSSVLNNLVRAQKVRLGRNIPLFKTNVEMADPFIWNPTEHDKKLDDIMAYQAHKGTPLGNLYEVLYTAEERNTLLNEGFRGRPSIGAAVMARRIIQEERDMLADKEAEPWGYFVKKVKNEAKNGEVARIFIAGSVFGGTGAAGLPTISRLLKNIFSDYCAEGRVIIGGAFMLPFFSFAPQENDELDGQLYASSENFLTNTQAALSYYGLKDKTYDAMYFIGDNMLSPVKNFSIGAKNQQNDASIVEMYAALAAIDFYQSNPKNLKECSYISRSKENEYFWKDFPNVCLTNGKTIQIKDIFGDYVRFIFAYIHLVRPVWRSLVSGKTAAFKYPWYIDLLKKVDIDGDEVKGFDEYTDMFLKWLSQIEEPACQREINLIKRDSFTVEPSQINSGLYSTCVCGEDTKKDINDIWYRLCSTESIEAENAAGFGKFLRILYNCCKQERREI